MKKPLSQKIVMGKKAFVTKIVVATSCMYVNLHRCNLKLLSVQQYLAPLNSVATLPQKDYLSWLNFSHSTYHK